MRCVILLGRTPSVYIGNMKMSYFKGMRIVVGLIGLVSLVGVNVATMAAAKLEEVRAAVNEIIGSRAQITDIKLSPMEGVYEVTLGGRTMYASQAGKHLIVGEVYDFERKVSLAEELKQEKAKVVIAAMAEKNMIIFGDENAKRMITVYTDVDCGYCQKLHREVPALVAGGVKVRYLWYPRAGIYSDSYNKAVSVWCADDQQVAMDNAKLNRSFTDKTCDPNPVAEQYQSGQQVGVRGTPTIVVDDGTIIGGYRPAASLLKDLGLGG